jgi:hypothetical protein
VCPEFIFPCGDVSALAERLSNAVADRARLQAVSELGVEHMRTWAPERNIDATIRAIESAVARKRRIVTAPEESPGWLDTTLCVWIVAAQVWYYLQFREQFRTILSLTLRKLWR